MSALDRVVAGLSCREVLHRLSPYLDGELATPQVQQVEAHLAGCDTCARFGGHVGAIVQQVKASLDHAPMTGHSVVERVMARVGKIERA